MAQWHTGSQNMQLGFIPLKCKLCSIDIVVPSLLLQIGF